MNMILLSVEAISKILRREGGEFGKDARKPPERARRWPFRPSSTRDKADEADFPKATAATEVFLRWLLVLALLTVVSIAHAEGPPLPIYKQPAQDLKMQDRAGYDEPQLSPKPGWKSLPQRRDERTSSAPWWAHVLLWVPNRLLDLIDVFRIDVGAGPAVGGVARFSRHAQMGYRQMLPFSLRIGDFGRQVPFALETDDEVGFGRTFQPSSDRMICKGEIGLGLDLGLGAYLGICPTELLDFFTGLVFVDLESDDIR